MSPANTDFSRYRLPSEPHYRMSSEEFTRTLTQPATPVGLCHCGNNGLVFPVKRVNPKTGHLRVVGWHCWLCRCDEHTPESHALWTKAQRKDQFSPTSTTQFPGCGRRCTHGDDSLFDEPFPTFEEWRREHGGAAVRDALREEHQS